MNKIYDSTPDHCPLCSETQYDAAHVLFNCIENQTDLSVMNMGQGQLWPQNFYNSLTTDFSIYNCVEMNWLLQHFCHFCLFYHFGQFLAVLGSFGRFVTFVTFGSLGIFGTFGNTVCNTVFNNLNLSTLKFDLESE